MDNKHAQRPIDLLPDDPFTAIEESWSLTCPSFVMNEILFWSYMAMSHQSSLYAELNFRAGFIGFFTDLLPFLEATYLYAHKKDSEEKPDYLIQYLSEDEQDDPIKIIRQFFDKYSHVYVRIELWFFYQAVEFYKGPLKVEYNTSEFYLHLLTQVEAFYLIVGTS